MKTGLKTWAIALSLLVSLSLAAPVLAETPISSGTMPEWVQMQLRERIAVHLDQAILGGTGFHFIQPDPSGESFRLEVNGEHGSYTAVLEMRAYQPPQPWMGNALMEVRGYGYSGKSGEPFAVFGFVEGGREPRLQV